MKNKAILAALTVNAVIAVMKFTIAFLSGSASLFSEGIHSSADTLNQVVLLAGKRKARQLPDQKHPFGYSSAAFFASFCVATLLFFVGGAFSLMEAIEKIEHTVHGTGAHVLDMRALLIAAVILGVSIVLELFSFRTALKEVHEEQEKSGLKTSLPTFYKETRNSSLIVVVTEDLAAVVGLGIALAGVLLTLFTGDPLWDAVGGAAIGILLIFAAFVLGREIASLILGESLPDAKIRQIEEIVNTAPAVRRCRKIKTLALGADSVLVEIDAEFPADGSVSAAEILHTVLQIKQNVKSLWEKEDVYVSTCVEAVLEREDTDDMWNQ